MEMIADLSIPSFTASSTAEAKRVTWPPPPLLTKRTLTNHHRRSCGRLKPLRHTVTIGGTRRGTLVSLVQLNKENEQNRSLLCGGWEERRRRDQGAVRMLVWFAVHREGLGWLVKGDYCPLSASHTHTHTCTRTHTHTAWAWHRSTDRHTQKSWLSSCGQLWFPEINIKTQIQQQLPSPSALEQRRRGSQLLRRPHIREEEASS